MARKKFHTAGRVDEWEKLDWEKFTDEKQARPGPKRWWNTNDSIPFCPLDPEERHTAPRDPIFNFARFKTS